MISAFQRKRHSGKCQVNKTFTHKQEQKKAMSPRHSAYIPSSVKLPLITALQFAVLLYNLVSFFVIQLTKLLFGVFLKSKVIIIFQKIALIQGSVTESCTASNHSGIFWQNPLKVSVKVKS